MNSDQPAAISPLNQAAAIKTAKSVAHAASHKADLTQKVATLAKGRYKLAKKSYKLARKAAKRAAKAAKHARKRLVNYLALAARGKKKKTPPTKTAPTPGKRRMIRKAKSKPTLRPIPTLQHARIPATPTPAVTLPPPIPSAPLVGS
jgi:ATPase subunit of ABC transporter with duplicated ATPase domains